jgi:hypothetical protein
MSCSDPSPCPAQRRTWCSAQICGLRSHRAHRGDMTRCRAPSMCEGGEACSRARPRRARCASSLHVHCQQGPRQGGCAGDEPIKLGTKRKMFSVVSPCAGAADRAATPLLLDSFRVAIVRGVESLLDPLGSRRVSRLLTMRRRLRENGRCAVVWT